MKEMKGEIKSSKFNSGFLVGSERVKGTQLRVLKGVMWRPRGKGESGMSQVYFEYASSMLQVCFRYSSSMLNVYFKYASGMLQVCFKYASRVLQVCFKYASSML
jgi:hypothetical protein